MHPYARILHFGLLKTHKQTFCISWRTLTRLLAGITRSWAQTADRGHTSPSSQNVESLNAPFALRPPQTLHHYIVRSPMGPNSLLSAQFAARPPNAKKNASRPLHQHCTTACCCIISWQNWTDQIPQQIHNVTRNVGLKMLDLRQLMFIPTTCWRRQSVTGLKSKSVPDLRDQLHTLHTVHIVVQWLYNKMYNIHCNLCWLYNLLAPQGARGGLAFYVGSNPLFLVHCDFECVAVLPPSAICDGILFDLSRQYFTFEPCSVVTNTVQRISLRGTSLQYAQLLAHSCRAWPN